MFKRPDDLCLTIYFLFTRKRACRRRHFWKASKVPKNAQEARANFLDQATGTTVHALRRIHAARASHSNALTA